METLQLSKLSQAIKNTTNKLRFCGTLAVTALDEDEIDGLSRIIDDCVEELEQAANTIDMLKPADYAMKQRGRLLKAVPMTIPTNGNGAHSIA